MEETAEKAKQDLLAKDTELVGALSKLENSDKNCVKLEGDLEALRKEFETKTADMSKI